MRTRLDEDGDGDGEEEERDFSSASSASRERGVNDITERYLLLAQEAAHVREKTDFALPTKGSDFA